MDMKLSDRVEAHTGGDNYALRRDIAEAIGWTSKQVGGVVAWYSPDQPDMMQAGPLKWLTSLDAAKMLVPEGWNWMAGMREQCHARAYVSNGKPLNAGNGLRRNPESIWHEVTAASPAIALTAAALRARGL